MNIEISICEYGRLIYLISIFPRLEIMNIFHIHDEVLCPCLYIDYVKMCHDFDWSPRHLIWNLYLCMHLPYFLNVQNKIMKKVQSCTIVMITILRNYAQLHFQCIGSHTNITYLIFGEIINNIGWSTPIQK